MKIKNQTLVLTCLSLILLLACSFFDKKQEKSNSDLNKLNLKGKVVSIQQQLYKVEDETDDLTNEVGVGIKWYYSVMHTNVWDILSYLNYSFEINFDKSGNIIKIKSSEYDVTYNFEDNIKTGETWRRDYDAQFVKFKYIYHEGLLASKKTNHDDDITTWKYKYNERGVLSELTITSNNGDDGGVYFEYDSKGKIEEIQWYKNEGGKKTNTDKVILDYDESGNQKNN